MPIDVTALPSELLVTPLPLIGFSGLDITHNAVHKSIWDAFNTNRKVDRAAVQFKLLPPNYEFPTAKPKRPSYEWYQPKGILKRNWMLKHLHVIPSVVVLFQELEWNDPQWTEKQMQCVSAIQALRTALQERQTRLCLVILQKASNVPVGDDVLSTERMASLTSACNINSKMLFILPHSDHLMGYILRLESAFLDMAQAYYALMSRRIRTHRDQLTTAHITLKIRHQFKLGFIAEIRQDFSTSLKHYSQSYAHLNEIRIVDSNCLEVKTIAGFLNYKICRLMFKLKVPRDSINHFISHIEKYRNYTGYKDLIFEHYAWLSTQHSVFAELFCEAIKNGLPALQTQHPGIYYHKAAEYTLRRKEAFLQSTAILASPSDPINPGAQNNLTGAYSEFYGIRTTKSGELMSEQLTAMIRTNEKTFNHSGTIINLLGLAMAQFKIYKCLRFRKKLAIDMAEEYFKSGDHAKALTLYSLMLPDYRTDNWAPIFSDVLLKTLRSAQLAASVTDYVSCCIESLSFKIRSDQKTRITVLENLWKVFQGVPPVSQYQITPEIRELWENALTSPKTPIQISLDKISELIEVYATFDQSKLKNDEQIKVFIIIKLLTDVPIKINSICSLLSDGTNTYKLPATKYIELNGLLKFRELHEGTATNLEIQQPTTTTMTEPNYKPFDANLKLEPEIYYEFVCTTEAQQFMENTELRILRTEILMGTNKLSAVLSKNAIYQRNPFRSYSRHKHLEDHMSLNPICNITPTFHLNTQTNFDKETMLVNEYYAVTTTVFNPHNVFLRNVGLNVSVPSSLRNKVFLTTDVLVSRQKLHSQIQIDIGELSVQSSNTLSFYVFSLVEAIIPLQQRIWYTIDVQQPKSASSIMMLEVSTTPTSSDNSPEGGGRTFDQSAGNVHETSSGNTFAPAAGAITTTTSGVTATPMPVLIEFLDESRLRKTLETQLDIKCALEFEFVGRFYTLNKKPLTKVYRGENFLLRVNTEVRADCELDILETYFICDHNLVQSTYSFRRKSFTNTYRCGDKLEDVLMLCTNASHDEWITPKDYENSKGNHLRLSGLLHRSLSAHGHATTVDSPKPEVMPNAVSMGSQMNKSLMAKIPTNVTIISNSIGSNSSLATSQTSAMSSSITSDDGKPMQTGAASTDQLASGEQQQHQMKSANQSKAVSTRLVFNKAMEAVQATGHCRGFIKGIVTVDGDEQTPAQQSAMSKPVFGVYCIKWRRRGCKDENESKFIVNGLDIEEPPLNIYCAIEEKMFVKMPMTYKVVLKNRTPKTLHLIATLSISNTDNFICSGHKQLDVSLFCYGTKELIYNLYPLHVGWQDLPELTLEYNTQADPTKNMTQNYLLSELVERSMPKTAFVLPPLKQHAKS